MRHSGRASFSERKAARPQHWNSAWERRAVRILFSLFYNLKRCFLFLFTFSTFIPTSSPLPPIFSESLCPHFEFKPSHPQYSHLFFLTSCALLSSILTAYPSCGSYLPVLSLVDTDKPCISSMEM